MTKGVKRATGLVAAAIVAVSVHRVTAFGASQDTMVLAAGASIERRLEQRDEHRYDVSLDAGEYVRVGVEQRGVDIMVDVHAPGGQQLAEFDDELRPAGEERVEIVGSGRGVYRLVIRAAPGTVAAGTYTIRLIARHLASSADRAMQESRTLRLRASQLYAQGRFDAARALLEGALAAAESSRGRDDLQTAVVAAQLAGVYRRLPDDAKSESLFRRALAIMERELGIDNPTTAVVRSRLAVLYQRMGDRARAEVQIRQASEAIEKSIGTDNRWFASCLATQAGIRHDGGDFDAEEAILGRAKAILERIDHTDSGLYAGLFSSLGEIYRERQNYDKAEALYQRSLAIGAKVFGADAYSTAPTLQNLGVLARERKDYATAQAYYARVLAIRERAVGPNHPDVAQVLNNIAIVYRATGDIRASLETHLRALGIWEHAAGPYQDATLVSVGNIARTYAAAGDTTNAIVYQRRADAIVEKQLALNLEIGSERQKLLFLNGTAARTDRTLSLHLIDAPGNPDAASLAALVLLQRKGRVQDAMADTLAAARHHIVDVHDQDRLDRLGSVTAELSRLALSIGDPVRADERQQMIAALEDQKEALEVELSEHCAVFRAHAQPVTLEAVQAAIPPDAALLEFAIFRPFDARAERNAEAYGPPHYAGYVLRRQGPPRGVDLGAAAAIDEQVAALRKALRDPHRADVKARARAVDARVMQPLRAWFGDATRLLVSPDGELNLVPFEALVDEQAQYLIERHATTYLTSGRDLLRMQVPRGDSGPPAVFADPLFGERSSSKRSAAAGRAPTGADLSAAYFPPLAATADEARAIKTLFPDATLFTGSRARKSALQRVEAPRMLHIASHGFFLDEGRRAAGNPLLRSGLALAGANLAQEEADENGILTALEASALDLWGTKLVTLSACDTGLGEVRNGDGVYGLRRAFLLAGTETLVMSLWPVSDATARATMVAYYTALRAGLGRGDALRHAKLAMLKRPVRQHPFFWASFIQSGEWANLNGAR